MSGYTEHYNLKKPAQSESYDIDVANTNNEIIDEKLYGKVDKKVGKDLSTNDFTDGYKQKLDKLVEGTKGDSAYQVAVENGFEGTEEEWLTSLKGEKGDIGDVSQEQLAEATTPTKTVTGEELTIQDSANTTGNIYFEGKTEQEGTGDASSSNIRRIRNVGDNIQLFDKSKAGDLRYYNSSGVLAASTIWNLFELIPEKNTDYTIRVKEKTSTNVYIVGIDSNNNVIPICAFTDTTITFNSGNYAKICYSVHANDLNNCKLERGKIATLWTPYGCGSVDLKVQNEDSTKEKLIQFPLAEGQVLSKALGVYDYLGEDGIVKVLEQTDNTGTKSIDESFEILDKPIVIPYTEEQEQALKPLLFEGYNNITCLDEIKPNMNLTYYTNNNINNTYAKRIDKVEKRLAELEALLSSQS